MRVEISQRRTALSLPHAIPSDLLDHVLPWTCVMGPFMPPFSMTPVGTLGVQMALVLHSWSAAASGAATRRAAAATKAAWAKRRIVVRRVEV